MLMSFVSIGLGVINLVPIPILDGGQICLLTIEKKSKDLHYHQKP